jgi:hypothetical protein
MGNVNEQLAKAIDNEDVEGVTKCLKQEKVDVNLEVETVGAKLPPLLRTAWYCYNEDAALKITRLLLDAKARTDVTAGTYRWSCLHFCQYASVARLLIKSGAAVDAQIIEGSAPLVTNFKTPEVVKALIEAKGDVNAKNSAGESALYQSAQYAYVETVKLLLSAGCQVTQEDLLVTPWQPHYEPDTTTCIALMRAAMEKNKTPVTDQKTPVTGQKNTQPVPATSKDKQPCNGVDPNQQLADAIQSANVELVGQCLKQEKVDVNKLAHGSGYSPMSSILPLRRAVRCGNKESAVAVVRMLLNAKANVNKDDSSRFVTSTCF